MITRLKVNGFKNLVDVDVRFGPFTCIAGPNAVGKSNLFDAIRFLSALASKTLMEAALSVRSETAQRADVRNLFHRVGDTMTDRMSFEVEMITPAEAVDDLGQTAKAKANYLRYILELRYRQPGMEKNSNGPLEIIREDLRHVHLKEASKHLLFPRNISRWQKHVLHIGHRAGPFISTRGEGKDRVIYLHADGGKRGRGISNAVNQPRTVLSVGNASESSTVLCARREMESWHLLQLEPSALREPDSINAPPHLESNGQHLPATLRHLALTEASDTASQEEAKARVKAVYARISNRLSELVDDIGDLDIDYDQARESLTLMVTGKDGTSHPARSLSDGTLRFLALSVLELDPHAEGVLCLEEPENGIHPARIPAMLNLLQDIAVDPFEPADATNPLRQVIINTHSPAVVLEVPDDCLLVVELRETIQQGQLFRRAVFSHLPDTWREKADKTCRVVPKGLLLAYLNPISSRDGVLDPFYARVGRKAIEAKTQDRPRVADRQDLQSFLPHVAE